LVGVPQPQLCEPIASVLRSLHVRRVLVVSGRVESQVQGPNSQAPAAAAAYLDEFSTLGENTVAEFYQDRGFALSVLSRTTSQCSRPPWRIWPGNPSVQRRHRAGSAHRKKSRTQTRRGVAQRAAALLVAGKARSLTEGWQLAAELIDRGVAQAKLAELAAYGNSRAEKSDQEQAMFKIIGGDGRQYGPVTVEQLREWIAASSRPQTQVSERASRMETAFVVP